MNKIYSPLRLITLLLSMILLGGCAQEVVRQFDYQTPVTTVVWPQTPDLPRYRLIGELFGETNFKQQKEGRSLLQIITGFFTGKARPNLLQRPQSGYTDEQGRVYVTDISRQALFVFDIPNNQLGVFGSLSTDLPFITPVAVSAAPQGDIYVSDSEHALVARLRSDGTPVSLIGRGVLNRPTGIAYDPVGKQLFVADTHDHDIKVFDEHGNFVESIGRRGEEVGEFNFPTHLSFRNGKLYITDAMNARIQILDSTGEFITAFGKRGLFIGNIPHPKGVGVDSDGNIYVSESYYDTLLVYNPEGKLLLPIGGTADTVGNFYLPAGVWTDNNNRVYLADMFNGRVVVLQYLGGE
ncbi:MAG: 6-bladed beta-propeller [Pseudomonadota bacterium]